MSTIDLFGCNEISMAGIKRLKLATRGTDELPLTFPLDFTLKVNDESIITLYDNESGRTITMGNRDIQYRIVYPFHASITEEETTDRQGRFYNQKLQWDMPQLNLTTINQLKSFLFTDNGEFAISNAVCFIEDLNDNLWCIGYTEPLVLENFEMITGANGEDNKYSLTYTCKSYHRIRQYELL